MAGAGVGGLLIAHVLADTFRRVTVVEPDVLDGRSGHRRGVPQSEHAHVLLTRGADALEDLLPGLRSELVAAGAAVAPARMGPGRGTRVVGPAGPFTDVEAEGETFLGVSRLLLEGHIRSRVRSRPTVDFLDGHRVTGLLVAQAVSRVTGVSVRAGEADGGAARSLYADLVVDATGRRSSMPRWLTEAGFPSAPETTIETGIGYASRWYRRPASPTASWDAMIINLRPGVNNRFGVLLPVENGECAVSIGGGAGAYPPSDEEGFLRWARDLPDRQLHDAIVESEPLSDISAYRTPTSRRRHYEKLRAWPQGLLVAGDAVCAFNPIYGQGMSVSALEALALRDCLRRGPENLERDFRDLVADIVAGPWSLATAEDMKLASVGSRKRRSLPARLRDRFIYAGHDAATSDPVVARTFGDIMMMRAEPTALLRPHTLARILRHRLRSTRGPRNRTAEPSP
ncbi:FAD-dependent monooxygenase [Pseudonocardia sp. DR1-2]|uniref:NAD(P)/FAD-dependent oxidoreductase n=1 Tax=Pseudonocardia sp. DR1-2 TaxID=2951168 RepID=UPI0020433778|nr:FAD-dependent monooxygenase [Pseudonocardia sp. DR1-2]MCM3849758.1 FAD-dependent monooxygenase [Pseudonocardia sp. DR1-2]